MELIRELIEEIRMKTYGNSHDMQLVKKVVMFLSIAGPSTEIEIEELLGLEPFTLFELYMRYYTTFHKNGVGHDGKFRGDGCMWSVCEGHT